MKAFVLALTLLGAAWAAAPEGPQPFESDPVGVIEGIAPGDPPPPDQIDARTRTIASNLRCPVCQGLSAADSTSAVAVAMQKRVRALVAAGYDRADIEDYFVSKYGEWVLLTPRSGGLNDLTWILPLAALGVAGVVILGLTRRGRDDDEGPDTVVGEPQADLPPEDRHMAALLAEVEDD